MSKYSTEGTLNQVLRNRRLGQQSVDLLTNLFSGPEEEIRDHDLVLISEFISNSTEVFKQNLLVNDELTVREKQVFTHWLWLMENPHEIYGIFRYFADCDDVNLCANHAFSAFLGKINGNNHFFMTNRGDEFSQIICDIGLPEFGREMPETAAQTLLKLIAVDSESRRYAMVWISHYLTNELKLSTGISNLIMYLLLNPILAKKPGPIKNANRLRNFSIQVVAYLLRRKFDFPLEENVTSNGQTISKIVATALSNHGESITQRAVRKVVNAPWVRFPGLDIDVGKVLAGFFPTT